MAPSTGKATKKKKSLNDDSTPVPVVASRKSSSSTASTSKAPSAASSRANSPFAGSTPTSSTSNALLGMLSPGAGAKLPSFKFKKATTSGSGTAVNGAASSKGKQTTTEAPAVVEEAVVNAAPGGAASASTKKAKPAIVDATTTKLDKGKQRAAAIEWTSSEGEDARESAPKTLKAKSSKIVLNRGNAKAAAKAAPKSKAKAKKGQKMDLESDGFATTGIGIEPGGGPPQDVPLPHSILQDTANAATAQSGSSHGPPVADASRLAEHSPSPVPPPYKTYSQPSTNPPSPILPPDKASARQPALAGPEEPSAEAAVTQPKIEPTELRQPVNLDDAFSFDLDAQIAAATNRAEGVESGTGGAAQHTAPISTSLGLFAGNGSNIEEDLDMEMDMEIEGEDEAPLFALQSLPASQGSTTVAKEESDDAEEDLFDFDKHLAAVMGGDPLSAPGDGVLGGLTPSNPFAYALLPSPEKANDDLPTSHLAEEDMPDPVYSRAVPVHSPPPVAVQAVPIAEKAESDLDDEDIDATAMDFDLNAMLANAMQQATSQVDQEEGTEDTPASTSAALGQIANPSSSSGAPSRADKLSIVPKQEQEGSDSDNDELDDEDDEGDGFDLDAQLHAAMAGNLETWGDSAIKPTNGKTGSSSSDEDDDEDDEEAGFDLDAHIGAAMGDLAVDSATASGTPTTSRQAKAEEGDFNPDDLQAMLKGAMRQAALELELEPDDLNEAEFDELMDYDEEDEGDGVDQHGRKVRMQSDFQDDMELDSGKKLQKIPKRPRFRPILKDDGDRDNAFNIARKANPHSLHTAYACDHQGCDKVFAKLRNREKHRATHNKNPALPFQCQTCPSEFAKVQDLKDHSFTHNDTREWRYRCKGCHNLFGDKDMLDRHTAAASSIAGASWSEKCRRGEFTLAFTPVAALRQAKTVSSDLRTASASARQELATANDASNSSTPSASTSNPFFQKSPFDSNALLAATLVNQLSTILAQQYDRQNSLLLPADPRIDVPLALSQTIARADLTASECAALASVLATVGHARNEGLKASLSEARVVQIQNLKRQHEHQDRIRVELKRREEEKEKLESQRKEKMKAAQEASGGDIPVPELQIPTS